MLNKYIFLILLLVMFFQCCITPSSEKIIYTCSQEFEDKKVMFNNLLILSDSIFPYSNYTLSIDSSYCSCTKQWFNLCILYKYHEKWINPILLPEYDTFNFVDDIIPCMFENYKDMEQLKKVKSGELTYSMSFDCSDYDDSVLNSREYYMVEIPSELLSSMHENDILSIHKAHFPDGYGYLVHTRICSEFFYNSEEWNYFTEYTYSPLRDWESKRTEYNYNAAPKSFQYILDNKWSIRHYGIPLQSGG